VPVPFNAGEEEKEPVLTYGKSETPAPVGMRNDTVLDPPDVDVFIAAAPEVVAIVKLNGDGAPPMVAVAGAEVIYPGFVKSIVPVAEMEIGLFAVRVRMLKNKVQEEVVREEAEDVPFSENVKVGHCIPLMVVVATPEDEVATGDHVEVAPFV
jgi:hypothetical protein